jgi:hypothetical protein
MLLCLEHATVHRSLWGTELDLFEKLVPGYRRHCVLLDGLRESGGCVLLKESSELELAVESRYLLCYLLRLWHGEL